MAKQRKDAGRDEKIGEGVGGVAGAAAGAAIGSLGGPVGTAIGAIAGAVGGWWSGRAVADAVDSMDTTDDDYYRQRFAESGGRDYDTVRPAFQLGHVAGYNPDYAGRSFEEIEPDLRRGWTDDVAERSDDWESVRGYVRDAFERGQERRITLAEERLAIGKRTVQESEVALRKHVDTRHVEKQVELMREEVSVERRPISADAATAERADIGEAEIRVPVMREEAVVEKRTVPVEEVVVRKETKSDTETVAADLRKETIDIDENIDTRRARPDGARTTGEATDRL